MTLCAILSLIALSPIDHENRRLDKDEKKKYKKTAGIISVSFGVIYLILRLFEADKYAVCISIGLFLAAGLQIFCVFQRKTEYG